MPLFKLDKTRHRENDFSLDPTVLSALWAMEDRHFWHRARNMWILKALRSGGLRPGDGFLEVGCGSGAVAGYLHGHGFRVTGVDTAEPLVEQGARRFPDVTFVHGELERMPPALRGPYSGAGLFDVLEHLEEPLQLLRTTISFCRPGALIAVTVPAQQALFSRIDEISGHKRRYEPAGLRDLLEDAGLEKLEIRGIFRWMRPLLAYQRRRPQGTTPERDLMLRNLRVPPWLANVGMAAACRLELGFWDFSNDSTGASLLATGRVPPR